MTTHWLSPVELAGVRLSTRIVMAPMTRARARANGVPGVMAATYYAQRATAGLLISEATNISTDAIGSPLTPGIFTDAHVQGWKKVTSAVHLASGRIFCQLWHTGRVGHSFLRDGRLPSAPSAIAIQGQQHFTGSGMVNYEVPHELTTAEVRGVIRDFGTAASRANEAGFDGVELHAAFGYLPNQFLVDGANHRTNEFGGPIVNRCRFVVDTMQALIAACGSDRVGIKLSPVIPFNGMIDADPKALFMHLITALDAMGPAYMHLMNPLFPLDAFPHWPKDVLGTFGSLTNSLVIANGGYDANSAEAELVSGRADMMSFGNLFIANPDLPARIRHGAALAAADRATMYGGDAHGYTDYPNSLLTERGYPSAAPRTVTD